MNLVCSWMEHSRHLKTRLSSPEIDNKYRNRMRRSIDNNSNLIENLRAMKKKKKKKSSFRREVEKKKKKNVIVSY